MLAENSLQEDSLLTFTFQIQIRVDLRNLQLLFASPFVEGAVFRLWTPFHYFNYKSES